MKPGVYFREFEDGTSQLGIYAGYTITWDIYGVNFHMVCDLMDLQRLGWKWIGEFE